MPEPHIKTLGIKRVATATYRTAWGYWLANVRNKAQIPVKETAAIRTVQGRNELKQKIPNRAAALLTI
jgi:hypothetical protein